MKVLVKLLSAYKSVSYVEIYSLLDSIFNSLWLIYSCNFLKFIQSNNTYSWIHIKWVYATHMSSEYHFVGVHRSNPFVSNLMSVYVIRSYVDIASISKLFLTKKNNKLLLYNFLNILIFTYPFYPNIYFQESWSFSSPNSNIFMMLLIFILTLKGN